MVLADRPTLAEVPLADLSFEGLIAPRKCSNYDPYGEAVGGCPSEVDPWRRGGCENICMLAVFVLDCADHEILSRLLDEGRLPAIRSLVARGCSVPLASDGDALDGSVFQTLLTGMNPGRHGIHKYRQLVPGTDRYAIAKAARSPVPQVWRVLSDAGRTCCVFDVPKAFPLSGFRGQLVASWGSYTPAPARGVRGCRADAPARRGPAT